MRQSVSEHEGKKYLRSIRSCVDGRTIEVDVYDVLKAFKVESHPVGHAIKKLLCAGKRGKGIAKDDLVGAIAAINRAIDDIDFEYAEWLRTKDAKDLKEQFGSVKTCHEEKSDVVGSE